MQLAMPRGEEDAARRFFVGVLGMSEIEKPPMLAARGGAWFRAGGLELHLGVEDDFRPARKGHPGILVNDLDEVVRRLGEAGPDVHWGGGLPRARASLGAARSATPLGFPLPPWPPPGP